MDVHVRDLRYFVAVAEELSFTRAASDRLFVSQPTLSKQIRQLELSFRTALFERDRRTVTLTAAGRALLPHARQMIEQWEVAQRAVADAAATQETTLTVGFQTSIGRGLIPAVTATMEKLLPGWRLQFRQVTWADPTVGLAGGDVDVAVAWLPVPMSGDFSQKVITREDRWVALPANHHLADRPVIFFEDLADEPFIALPAAAGALREFWLGNDHRRTPARIAATAETADETFEAVASGLGIVLLSAGNAEIYKRENLTCRPVTGLSPSELAVVWRAGDHREAVRVFIDACCLCTAA
ncbi:LysR family transcriptional regulator [Streptosporangium subroseum]|uniref:LysR family transcriptional regulator n=1 Tax=Streptosporangium subroseum TaxID=106412 RepID=UPI003092C1D7|nr:LysR family transcriptional regulator [Streptosporangium subroseum]